MASDFAADVVREIRREAEELETWADMEEAHAAGEAGGLFFATRLIVAETLRRVALAVERAEAERSTGE